MADAIVSEVAGRIISLIDEQGRYHLNLVLGAEEEVRALAVELQTVRNVLDDAEGQRFKNKTVRAWLAKLEHVSSEMGDILDEWNYALIKLTAAAPPKHKVWSFIHSSPCFCFKKAVVRHEIAEKILGVKENLDRILKENIRYGLQVSNPTTDPSPRSFRDQSTSFTNVGEVYGRDSIRDILVARLTDNGSRQGEFGVQVVSIVGVGGVGKTTLAQLIYNDSRVKKSFELTIWVCVSDPFDMAAVAKGIINGDSPSTTNLETLLQRVKETISGKKFLLVLDDVWTEEYGKWEHLGSYLRCGGEGSKVLVTTRNGNVAKMMGTLDSDIHRPGQLTDDDCWLLLSRIALLSGRDDKVKFENIGKKIAKKCNGLPLAAKTLGSLLRIKNTLEGWQDVLNSEIWQLEKAEVELFPHLLLSYNELPPPIKHCFSYCAVFPKDFRIDVESLIRSWMALGYLGSEGDMECRGRDYFDILAMHSLFQDFEKDYLDESIAGCKMHDIVHDFAQFLRKSNRVDLAGRNKTTCGACDPLLVESMNEFRSIFQQYGDAPAGLCDCLVHLRVLSLVKFDSRSVTLRLKNMIHLRSLGLCQGALSKKDLKIVFQLYNLQTLGLLDCHLQKIPSELGNLIELRHLDLSGNESLKELPTEIGNLVQLRHLDLRGNESLKELPTEIENLVQLRYLNLRGNKSLKELPTEIGNLVELRHLDLSLNRSLKELPTEIGNLVQLRYLDLSGNESLEGLPESICGLQELRTLDTEDCALCRIPQGLGKLTGLRSIREFRGGSGWSRLGLLKKLNHLGGFLRLKIKLAEHEDGDLEQVVEDAREAELRNKMHIQSLVIEFDDEMDEKEWTSSVRMDVLDALLPHPNLSTLSIWFYKGSKLPQDWMVSPHSQLREVTLYSCCHLSSLRPLGKLPCLKEVSIWGMFGLEIVGLEFFGITTEAIAGGDTGIQSSSSNPIIDFPKLETLEFHWCKNWKEWKDITVEEEEPAAMSFMPCLTTLNITDCDALTALPHHLLRKLSSLEKLHIRRSRKLEERYSDKNSSIFQNNPRLRISF